MLLLFLFSCGVDHLLCFAYLQNDLNDPFQYAFWRSNLRVLLKNCTLDSILTTWTRPVETKLKVTGHDCCGTRPLSPPPPPPAKSWHSKQSNPVNTGTGFKFLKSTSQLPILDRPFPVTWFTSFLSRPPTPYGLPPRPSFARFCDTRISTSLFWVMIMLRANHSTTTRHKTNKKSG